MTNVRYKARYHYGGQFLRSRNVRYMNGSIRVQDEDLDRLCFWDLMATAKKLGYNLDNYSVNIYYLKVGQTLVKGLKLIANDGDVLELADEMRRNMIVDIYFELVMGKRNMKLPEALVDHSEKDPINGQGDRVSAENLEHVSGQGERVAAENLEHVSGQGERVAAENLEHVSGQGERVAAENLEPVDGQDVIVENFEDEGNSDSENELERDSDEAFEEDLVDVQWDNVEDFDVDEELIEARQKVKEYVKRKRTLCLAAHIVDDSAPVTSDKVNVDTDKVPGYESDYLSESDPGSFIQNEKESEEDDGQTTKSSLRNYNSKDVFTDFNVGLRFQNLKMFKTVLSDFSTRQQFEFKYMKNDKIRVRAICSSSGCKWSILCSWCSTNNIFIVKTYNNDHSCLPASKNKRVIVAVIARKYAGEITAMPFIKPRHLRKLVRKDLGVQVSPYVCRTAKGEVIKHMEEKYKEEFQNLNNYAEELKATNYGSTVIVKSDSNSVFDRMYICFEALKRGFLEGCRPIIGLDGCFLKGLVKGQLLVAVGKDGNNQMFPIAWAVVHNENTETWSWFINQLCDDLEIGDGLGWAVISDMQKGLIRSVQEILPLVEQRMCARHIYARWGKRNSGKELQYQFWVTARSPNEPEMRKQLDDMAELENGLAAKEDLLEHWPVQGWCQAFFSDVVKCDVIDNNMCETFNGVILEARCKPIISMLEEIRIYVMKRLVLKREYMKKWKTNYAPRILERLEKSRKLAGKWEVEWNGSAKHEVYWDDAENHLRESYTVRLQNHSCTCRKWDISGVPCQHAVAAIMYEGADPLSYLSEYFCKEMYKKAYMHMLNPVKGQMFWPKSNDGPLLPPLVKRMPDRPAKKKEKGTT
ncbi:hypothetical protein PTKIN_Ptkin09bG0218700 [Pterospermum kingtungense]